jgi:acetyl-CoA carboxylase biotin carboxyl carrier protein
MADTKTSKAGTATSNLDLKEITQIVELMSKNNLSYFQLERAGANITLRRGHDMDAISEVLAKLPTASAPSLVHAAPVVSYGPPSAPLAPAAAPAVTAPAVAASVAVAEPAGPVVLSPMVGTFYRSSEPGSKPFINVGDTVDENTTVCIIEAMKVMNEIKAEKRGVVARILVEDGKPVQFGQQLFELK